MSSTNDFHEKIESLREFISDQELAGVIQRLDIFYNANPSHPSAQLWKDYRNKNEAHSVKESKSPQ